ncbi:MAG: prepilin-type N-terminal cleavage/methylation domain-containing protein [Verrucomicrobiales bacterium]|nr:prepilin-type N-terminal cleavage/methylation domain-containing protein [Verrucomicrobiales bacterium]
MKFPSTSRSLRGYTLIEALVGASVLAIGIGAAASMSLTLVTQEEINERSLRAFNYLDNATQLMRAGVDPSEIPAILPSEPLVTSLTSSSRNLSVAGIGNIEAVTLTMTYDPTGASAVNSASDLDWTGGVQGSTRSESVELILSESHLTRDLGRVLANP